MAATPVAQGEETLSVTVSVSWAIKQARAVIYCDSPVPPLKLMRASAYDEALEISNTCPGLSATNRSRGILASSSAMPNALTGASIASSVN